MLALADDGWPPHATLIATSIFPRVLFESTCLGVRRSPKLGRRRVPLPANWTLRRLGGSTRRRIAPIPSASMACVSRRQSSSWRAATPIAPRKQADQPAANNCSGLVPPPVVPGDESLMSKRPSELRDSPFSATLRGLWRCQRLLGSQAHGALLVKELDRGISA